MASQPNTRREFLKMAGLGVAALTTGLSVRAEDQQGQPAIDPQFFVRPEELTLKFRNRQAPRRLSFANYRGSPDAWRRDCRAKLAELLGFSPPAPCKARLLRTTTCGEVAIELWIMQVDDSLSIPAYFLSPRSGSKKGLMAIHGHGQAEPCVGSADDYHHAFALNLARAGHAVLCPALRGFGALGDVARGLENHCLDYWVSSRGHQFTLVTDAFLYGKTLIGQTIEDLLRWEQWLADAKGITTLDVAGISYGGDLAITYPALSERVRKIYSSGSLGSFSVVFSRCYNAPAHCIPGVLQWMDRSDIAGLSAPRPIRLHYGEGDVIAPWNNSASYNETVEPSMAELKAIYEAFNAQDQVSLRVTPKAMHEMENEDLKEFLAG
ncbi:MAG TPA: twin-arginine translocation signal domain-containing protein [Sedimentisphaerales bacterium]|jgi:dienelactone hydrolase|nr:twin-arginine translocation signal domain-containing protein [Sedimentisphaerales bacterium]HNU27559.1 twin-arginine translocation signal domain-containing protein [Sedimentisphaerales bacterium]